MNKYTLLVIANFLLIFFIFQGCAKPKVEHITFMDISMELTIDKFTNKLEDKGFKHIAKEGDMAIMQGEFLGSVVQIAIQKEPVSECVAMVVVEFPTESDKGKARELYYQYGELIDKKYPDCFIGKESNYFQHLIENPDVDKIDATPDATLGDYTTYFASWKIPKGEVIMRVYNTCQFQLIYADSINFECGKNEITRKMNSDL